MTEHRTYAVTLHAYAEMVVWVENCESAEEAKSRALEGDYDTMTDWEPVSYATGQVKAVKAKRSKLPEAPS